MINKKCNKCKQTQSINNFYKDKTKKDGFRTICKSCHKKYILINIDYILESNKKRANEYYKINREKVLKRVKEYQKINIIKIKKYQIHYRKFNKSKIKEYDKNHRKEINQKRNQRLKENISLKILHNLRGRIRLALKGICKSKKTLELIGCSVEELKAHLEKQFKPNMSWKNYGYYGWHIDHIKPCCQFNLNKEEEQKLCFNWQNLQPLWREENMKKGKKCQI
jgi:hypothetical protein